MLGIRFSLQNKFVRASEADIGTGLWTLATIERTFLGQCKVWESLLHFNFLFFCQVTQFLASALGMSRADLPTGLRNRLASWHEGPKGSKRKKRG